MALVRSEEYWPKLLALVIETFFRAGPFRFRQITLPDLKASEMKRRADASIPAGPPPAVHSFTSGSHSSSFGRKSERLSPIPTEVESELRYLAAVRTRN